MAQQSDIFEGKSGSSLQSQIFNMLYPTWIFKSDLYSSGLYPSIHTLTFHFFWKTVTTPAYWRPTFRHMAIYYFDNVPLCPLISSRQMGP